MRSLSSSDPEVTRLRQQAEQELSLGAFDTARATLMQAADIDGQSRKALKENFVERTVSEATTRYLAGGAARADLRYQLAIDDYENAAAREGLARKAHWRPPVLAALAGSHHQMMGKALAPYLGISAG